MINYSYIAQSIDHFNELGYKRIEAPWWVSKEILKITTPEEFVGKEYHIAQNNKCSVASGEQSFLYMVAKDRLLPGKYQTTTPCFRNESIGKMRKKCFIKNELIITNDVTDNSVSLIVIHALMFFKTIVPNKKLINVVDTKEGYDIEYRGIELGSYGMRECEILKWIYGTACAEPRLSKAILSL